MLKHKKGDGFEKFDIIFGDWLIFKKSRSHGEYRMAYYADIIMWSILGDRFWIQKCLVTDKNYQMQWCTVFDYFPNK